MSSSHLKFGKEKLNYLYLSSYQIEIGGRTETDIKIPKEKTIVALSKDLVSKKYINVDYIF